jgi:hypothetical protein
MELSPAAFPVHAGNVQEQLAAASRVGADSFLFSSHGSLLDWKTEPFEKVWPPRSPDFTPPNFFHFVYLKEIVYWNKPHEPHKTTSDFSSPKLRRMLWGARRVQLCLAAGGGHFQHLV